ncbi:MAG TPA: 30S ribosomal protein S8 [Candidatus Onthoplasma faecipullorum]|nr:30S ribosomal protein S8 [Candidatus Onthoplasma faecipullorum]
MYTIDPIADMLTRIRNANSNKQDSVLVPQSKTKLAIAEILKNEGFITDYKSVVADGVNMIEITLKYGPNGEKVIQGLKRISKPGLRIYANSEELPQVLNGLGIAIISTSKGIITDKNARKLNVGGEVIAYVW